MAYYLPSPTTFCEVTYDSDWLNFEKDDRHLTPYRYSLVRNDTDTNSDTVSLTLPSYTYYEYLRSLYDCRSTPTRVPPPGYAGPAGSHIGQQGRSVTWHAFSKDNASELSRQAVKSEPTRIRPTYPFPSLHLVQGGDSADELDDEYAYADRTKEKLVWVDALNKWVPQKQLHPRPYMSFVGNAPVLEKHGRFPREIAGGSGEFEGAQTCERFEMHMGQRTSVSQPQDKSKSRNNEKREAIRKRAHELAEQKKQRKAYSTPLYTSLTERKQNLKPRVQSSRTHSSLPVSPVHRKEKIPSPKEVWQAEEGQKQTVEKKPAPIPVKREISIKLVSPTPADVKEDDEEEDKDKLSEKKVTFIDEGKTTPKSSKKKKGKRRKGKGKSQPKQTKVEKSPKKPVKKVEEEKSQVSEEKLPVSKPSEIEPIVEEEIIKPKSPAYERRKSIIQQREVVKKEKRDGRKCVKKVEEIKALPDLEVDVKKVESWIYEAEDFSEKKDLEKEELQVETEPLPSLSADLNPEFIEKEKKERKEKRRKSVLANLISSEKAVKKWRKPGHLDSSYADELRRLELAEERRKRQMEMFERLKNRRVSNFGEAFDDGSPRFEDYGFLAKYCIFTKGNIEMYRHAFDAVDEGQSGWLEGEDVMIALRGVNNKLTEAEEEYLYRVLELTGYKLTHGADFKIFSVLAALSQRISALDKWMKNLIGKMDFKALEMKMFKCKTLWECNVDKDTNSISIDQLCVDLRAGGVSYEHEMEVREKLAHLHAIDLLDFLTYIPLFIMIHEAVVKNPLDDTRNK